MRSVGLLLHRRRDGVLEILLGHMGGPFWAKKDDHAWSIPKGIQEDGESDLLAVAEREFAEEMGSPAPGGPSLALGEVPGSRKTIHIFAREGDFDADAAVSNTFTMEWPPKSGRMQEFPEIDRAAWMTIAAAREKLANPQLPFLERLETELGREVVEREAGRALLVDPIGRALMIRAEGFDDLVPGGFWITPGGGLDPGESIEDGTKREIYEELGIEIETLGPVVMRRRARFPFANQICVQTESIFLVEVPAAFEPQPGALTGLEEQIFKEFRWLSADEVRALEEPSYPHALADLLDHLAASGPPEPPWVENLSDEG